MRITESSTEGEFLIGIDVGSTTVKAVVLDDENRIVWKDYHRHNAKQLEHVRDFLVAIDDSLPQRDFALFTTGSGGRALAQHLGANYIQEVNAVAYAVERRHPDVRSVIELGGQDAKVIIRQEDEFGRKSMLTYMNDKCAGGTGATIDRIFNKFGLTSEEASELCANRCAIHHISAKCGVFSETDVVGLLKTGIDRRDIFVSLCTAIAKQNLEVLVRGNILMDEILLLGGPHTFFNVFGDIWRSLIPETWRAHKWPPPTTRSLEELIYVPPDAQYFAALGAAMFGAESARLSNGFEQVRKNGHLSSYVDALHNYLSQSRLQRLQTFGSVKPGLVRSQAEIDQCVQEYSLPPFSPPRIDPGTKVRTFIGIDGGSTSTKLAVIDQYGELLHRDYVLSLGNPIVDVRKMFGRMVEWRDRLGLQLELGGVGVTGYAAQILKEAFNFDVSIVETVAHLKSATKFYGNVDIVCDVGGQDIKVLFSKHGRVVHFKINTQCSAGNGYFLQAIADQFGYTVEEYTDAAFQARRAPTFNCGCAVFMEQDKVNFQQMGWTKEEIMAGLALVLPQNIWHYVVQDANIARLGRRIVLQGGTQRNLAAVKAQADYIKSRVPDAEVLLHRHADICGAIGAALEASERSTSSESTFVGLENASSVTFQSRVDESTRCRFCSNRCPRTFVNIDSGGGRKTRYISGYRCEKGMSVDRAEMQQQLQEKRALRARYPNLVQEASERVFDAYPFEPLPHAGTRTPREVRVLTELVGRPRRLFRRFRRSQVLAQEQRRRVVVGIPKVLNNYYNAPFFNAYFRTLGVADVVYSDYTTDDLWHEGNKWGAIDPCFPAKVAPAHVYNLLKKPEVTHIFFPIMTHLQSTVSNTFGNTACVIQMGTPEVVDAAFTRHHDFFTEKQVGYWKPLIRMDRPREAAGCLFDYFGKRLDITEDENAWAVAQGYAAMDRYLADLRNKGRQTIDWLVENERMGIVVIGHPYHHDPGLNHGIPEQFQLKGFPVLCIESLPVDPNFLKLLFANETKGDDELPWFSISDVWQRNFNRNTNHKVWAAKIAARHPNLAVIDFSSFKCGHDAPTYSYVDAILDASGTPHFLFHDIDQNKPSATHTIRVQTIEYFLRLEEQRLMERSGRRSAS